MHPALELLDPAPTSALRQQQLAMNRRQLIGRGATGIGIAALASLLQGEGLIAADTSKPQGLAGLPHFAPRAKRVIFLFQNGAPTHIDLFDYKPRLHELHGTPVPEEYLGGKRFSTMTGNPSGKIMLQPIEPFKQQGQSGA